MLLDKTPGLYCEKDKTWYYLESGNIHTGNPLDKIRTVLLSRGLITHVPDVRNTTPQSYQIVVYKDARRSRYKIKPIYISKHVEKLVKGKETTHVPEKSAWS